MTAEALGSLARFARRARRASRATDARCEICAAPSGDRHRHVVDRSDRRILCACAPCALTFAEATTARYRTVPETVRREAPGVLTPADLQRLGVPVGLAFFFRCSKLGRIVGVFPSPAGPTEAELDDERWSELAARSALAAGQVDDVEALLVRSQRGGSATVYVVPIDVGYELVALVRSGWRGIDGGAAAQTAQTDVDAFFARLDARAGGAS